MGLESWLVEFLQPQNLKMGVSHGRKANYWKSNHIPAITLPLRILPRINKLHKFKDAQVDKMLIADTGWCWLKLTKKLGCN